MDITPDFNCVSIDDESPPKVEFPHVTTLPSVLTAANAYLVD